MSWKCCSAHSVEKAHTFLPGVHCLLNMGCASLDLRRKLEVIVTNANKHSWIPAEVDRHAFLTLPLSTFLDYDVEFGTVPTARRPSPENSGISSQGYI